METITERAKILIAHKTTAAKRFKELEDATGIASGTWRTWWNKDSRPSGEMIEVLCAAWPEFAFWLATGITDSEHGHHSPATDEIKDNWIPLEDKKLELRYRTKKRLRTAARDYFLAQIAMQHLPAWNEIHDNELERDKLQLEFLNLLREIDVLREIRDQQEATLASLEREAISKMTQDHGFDDSAQREASKRMNKENASKNEVSKYVAPQPEDDLPI
ncbi:hypothetical protein [Undibacterium griseum]|uniref:Uncharacterized protein n=1 Tax=Undibacterium griseum TaxID=2762295 RepID=A0ABR6YP30_9BURK|nr:hypothetical protein [Undibacterium griseum]MBC3885635.1 hypothetical protein [Undibacterium griseum]